MPKFWDECSFMGFHGHIVGKQLPLEANGMKAGYLVSFPKPTQGKGETDEQFQVRLAEYASTFKCNVDTLGPCCNRIILEDEIQWNS